MFKSKRNKNHDLDASIRSSTSSHTSRDRTTDELGMMSVPYDKLGPGGKVIAGDKTVSGRSISISSPNTNPTLTAEGTDLNIHAQHLPARRESNRSNQSMSASSNNTAHSIHRRDTTASSYSTDSAFSGNLPQPIPHTPTPASSGNPTHHRSDSTSSSTYSYRPATQHAGGPSVSARKPPPSIQSEHSAFSSISVNGASSSLVDHSGYPSPVSTFHQPSSSVPQSLLNRPSTSMSVASTRSNRDSTGRYPTFTPSEKISIHPPVDRNTREGLVREEPYGQVTGEASEKFSYPRPSREEVERLFEAVIDNTANINRPSMMSHDVSTHVADMRALSDDKKWMLVENDARQKWQTERDRLKRESAARARGSDTRGIYGKDTPEWYIQQFMSATPTAKVVSGLAVSLRTRPKQWLREFVQLQGSSVLSNLLGGISARSLQSRKTADLDLEYELVKCLKAIFNDSLGAADGLRHPQIVTNITCSLNSPNFATRRHAMDTVSPFCFYDPPRGYKIVLHSLSVLSKVHGSPSDTPFTVWLASFEGVLDGRGRMGSIVGMSEDLKRGLGGAGVAPSGEAGLIDYAIRNVHLMFGLVRLTTELEVRIHTRAQLDASGAQRIYSKLRDLNNEEIDKVLEAIKTEAEDDALELGSRFDQTILKDIDSPADILNAIILSVQGTPAQEFFLSVLRHLLLIRDDDETRLRYYQIINKLVATVVLDERLGSEEADLSTLLGVSVSKLASQFEDQDRLEKVKAQVIEMTNTAQQLALDKASLEEELASSGQGLVKQLTEKLSATEEHLKTSRLATQRLEKEMEEMKQMYEDRIANLELKIQELFNMLKESSELEGVLSKKGSGAVDREELLEKLERKAQLQKTVEKLEGVHRKSKRAKRRADGEEGVLTSEEEDENEEKESNISSVKGNPPKAKKVDRADRRIKAQSGSQFVDAEDDQVREHIGASLEAGLSKLNSPNSTYSRSARKNVDVQRNKAHLHLNDIERKGKPFLAPRFVEELKGRRVSRSASAPSLTKDDRDDFDGTESETTDRRESSWTTHTDDTRATSVYSASHSYNTSNNINNSRMPKKRDSKQRTNSITDGSSSALQPLLETSENPGLLSTSPSTSGEPGTFSLPNVPSPSPNKSTFVGIPPSPSPISQPSRPSHPFAAGLLSQIKSIKSNDEKENEEPISSPVSTNSSRPFSPFAALHAQIKGKSASTSASSDVDEDEEEFDPGLNRSRPSFLSDIDSLGKNSEGSLSSNASRFPFLSGIGSGASNLKSAGSRVLAEKSDQPNIFGSTKPAEAFPSSVKAPRKTVNYKASAKVRQLHWDKINELKVNENTVWSTTTDEKLENEWAEKLKELNIWSQMESTFSSQEAKLQIDKQKQVELLSVLDPKIRKLVEIFMKGYKIDDPEEIRVKILACDEKYCTLNFLENLSKFLPNPEQVGKLNSHKSDTLAELMLLHPADRLMVHLIKIPRLDARVNGMLFRARHDEKINMLEEIVLQTKEASLALLDAPKFRQLLSLILLIGNYLNGNSYAGGAYGFRIGSINKLVETKSSAGQNLLHFVERTVSNQFHDMEGFMDELDKASEGSRHDLGPVSKARSDMAAQLQAIDKEIKAHLQDKPISGDRYSQRMLRFAAEARDRLDALNDLRIEADATYHDALRYYNEDPNTPSNVFFGIFKTFVTSYRQCQKQNLTWAELEAAKERRKEAARQRAIEKAERDALIDDSAPVMDNIMESLRAMAPRRTRRAGKRADFSSASIAPSPSMQSLSIDLKAAGEKNDFGGQAMNILNTLRNRGFGDMGSGGQPSADDALDERILTSTSPDISRRALPRLSLHMDDLNFNVDLDPSDRRSMPHTNEVDEVKSARTGEEEDETNHTLEADSKTANNK
ncbi:RhoA GTPase effector DIA/Diaphanous [Phaffia rhodozyma]|uniref:RhoA GTPase effector DIA/Diaphanous n=1 Tax=Phaffia rhodozyma TaxID=264483 RepID=A0A0F7SLW1_PHARH|nr:RhoA GTPase effector DIA/Diaphanous [Phaffia rhodozyma]